MFVFALYAVLVWWAAAHWRRRWGAFAAVTGGMALLVVVAWFHYLLNEWTAGRLYLPVLQVVLYPYIALVGLIGYFVACLPRTKLAGHCRVCEYDLRGLEDETLTCPECGAEIAGEIPAPAESEPAPAVPVIVRRELPATGGTTLEQLARSRRERAPAPAAPPSPATAAPSAVLRSPER